MAEGERRLEVDEVRHSEQSGIEALAGQHDGERRLGGDDGVPRSHRVELGEDLLGVVGDELCQRRIELLAAPLLRERPGRADSPDAMRDLDELGELS